MSGVLSDNEIKFARDVGDIVIHPFKEENLGNCSYDVSLGKYYYQAQPVISQNVINPFSSSDVSAFWGHVRDASFEGGFISLPAFSIILVSTEEFIGARRDITTMLIPRSSLGRAGISMVSGGWGDIGYINRWTVCLSNNTSWNMKLPVGERFAQIIFLRSHYPNKLYSGQYQNSDDLLSLMKEWTPMSMLPKELK